VPGVVLGNLEGMTFGPRLPDGSRTLVFVSDNNFSSGQLTQFLAFKVVERSRPGTRPGGPTPPGGDASRRAPDLQGFALLGPPAPKS
jgi:hypothetical protein